MRIIRWNALGRAAQKRGTNRTEVVNRLIEWWLGNPDAPLPERLSPEEWQELLLVKEDLAEPKKRRKPPTR